MDTIEGGAGDADDKIFTGNGPDVVLGGNGNDDITGGTDAGRDVILGDNGFALFDPAGPLVRISTSHPTLGGSDRILTGDGPDVVFGGIETDFINFTRPPAPGVDPVKTGFDEGNDIMAGDNGFAVFDAVTGHSTLKLLE